MAQNACDKWKHASVSLIKLKPGHFGCTSQTFNVCNSSLAIVLLGLYFIMMNVQTLVWRFPFQSGEHLVWLMYYKGAIPLVLNVLAEYSDFIIIHATTA